MMQKILSLLSPHGPQVLHSVLLFAQRGHNGEQGWLTLSTTDLGSTLLYKLPAQVLEEGEVLVPKHFTEWVRTECAPMVSILQTTWDTTKQVTFEGYYASEGKGYPVTFRTRYKPLRYGEYPLLPLASITASLRTLSRVVLPVAQFTKMLSEVLPFTLTGSPFGETTSNLQLSVMENTLLARGTDSFRAAQSSYPLARSLPGGWEALLDRQLAGRIKDILPKEGQVCVQYDAIQGRLLLSTPDGTLTLVAGTVKLHPPVVYPTQTFTSLFSSSSRPATVIQVSPKPLIQAIERILKMAESKKEKDAALLSLETLSVDHIQVAPYSPQMEGGMLHPQTMPAVVREEQGITYFKCGQLLDILKRLIKEKTLLLERSTFPNKEGKPIPYVRISPLIATGLAYAITPVEPKQEEGRNDEKEKSVVTTQPVAAMPV